MAILQDAIYTDPAKFSQIAAGIVGLPVGQSVNNLNLVLTPSVLAASQIINAAPSATTITAVNAKSLTGTGINLVLPAITPAANGGGITLTGISFSQGAISNVADSEAITVKQIVITGAAGVALATGVYTWSGIDITTPAQAANAANNLGYGIKITGGAVAGAATAAQCGVYINMTQTGWNYNDAIYIASGRIQTQHGMLVLVTPSLTAAGQTVNPSDASQATTITGAAGVGFTGIGMAVVLPAIAPQATASTVTLTGMKFSQGAITNTASTMGFTVKQIVITGASGVALATGAYLWDGVNITMPAQAANGADNYAYGVKITGGAKAGSVSAFQRGIDITMADATDNAIYVTTGQSYFGGNIFLADGATIGQAAGPLLTFNDTSNYLAISGAVQVSIAGGVLNVNGSENWLKITGTLSNGTSNDQIGIYIGVTGAGAGGRPQFAFYSALLAGYTGSNQTSAGYFANGSAGAGNVAFSAACNIGNTIVCNGTTANGVNVGSWNYAANGLRNYGSFNIAIVAKNSAANIGVAGFALNTGTSPIQIGGFFGLMNSIPTYESAALIADNGATTSPIFLARDNGTTIFSILDGGNVILGAAAAGASALKCLALSNGATAPSASADLAHLFAADIGASGAALALWQEFAPYAGVAVASTTKIPITVNGVAYYILATTVA